MSAPAEIQTLDDYYNSTSIAPASQISSSPFPEVLSPGAYVVDLPIGVDVVLSLQGSHPPMVSYSSLEGTIQSGHYVHCIRLHDLEIIRGSSGFTGSSGSGP